MGITIGDALTVSLIFTALCLSVWSLTIAAQLLFRSKTTLAKEKITNHPYWCGFSGLIVAFIWGGLSAAIAAQPNPVAKIVGLAGIGLLRNRW